MAINVNILGSSGVGKLERMELLGDIYAEMDGRVKELQERYNQIGIRIGQDAVAGKEFALKRRAKLQEQIEQDIRELSEKRDLIGDMYRDIYCDVMVKIMD